MLPSQEDEEIKRVVKRKLDEIVVRKYPSSVMQMYGSAVNGFATRDSDMDCTVLCEGQNFREVCAYLRGELPKHGFVRIQVIEARVPLIKMHAPKGNFIGWDPNDEEVGLAVDISFNNVLGVENSQMLRAYGSLDICRHLGILVKIWARRRGIIDAQNGLLSSYSFMLLVGWCIK